MSLIRGTDPAEYDGTFIFRREVVSTSEEGGVHMTATLEPCCGEMAEAIKHGIIGVAVGYVPAMHIYLEPLSSHAARDQAIMCCPFCGAALRRNDPVGILAVKNDLWGRLIKRKPVAVQTERCMVRITPGKNSPGLCDVELRTDDGIAFASLMRSDIKDPESDKGDLVMGAKGGAQLTIDAEHIVGVRPL